MICPVSTEKRPSVLRGRDRLLIAAVVLANAVVVVAVLTLTGSDDEDPGGRAETTPPPAPAAGPAVANPAIGARLRKPKGWTDERSANSLILRSPDATTLVSISLPPGVTTASSVLRSARAAIAEEYRDTTFKRQPGEVAGLPTVSLAASAVNRKGTPLNIFVSAAQGRERAWLVEIFSAPGARSRRLPEAQVAIGTLQLSG